MDSMAMAALFAKAGYSFGVIHCNFKLRGAEADADEQFVKEFAYKYNVPCYSKAFETEEISRATGDSIQMVARDLRYAFFNEIAKTHKYDFIATAHHKDDQTETFLINLLRGCGIGGLHGIRLKNDSIVRPMMFAFRKDIENFVIENKIAFREDKSNSSLNYLRNKVRHQLIPLFMEMNPAFDEEMQANISRLTGTEKIFKEFIDLKRKELLSKENDIVKISIAKLKKLDPADVYLYEFISPYGFQGDDVSNIIAAFEGISGKQFYSKTHQLLIDREEVLITAISAPRQEQEFSINEGDRLIEEPLKIRISINSSGDFAIPHDKHTASLNLEKLAFPLKLRSWKQGDSFIPLGMKNKKKLSDFFIDNKFSRLEKEKAWILCSGDDIVWVVGSRIDDRYKVTDSTEHVYYMEVTRNLKPGG